MAIFKIRETLGRYIYETLTLTKFKIPLTKEELAKKFKNIIGEEYLPHINGGKIPDEGLKPYDKIDLREISNAEPTSLEKLLEKAKKFLETEDLNKRIVVLTNRLDDLEKKS